MINVSRGPPSRSSTNSSHTQYSRSIQSGISPRTRKVQQLNVHFVPNLPPQLVKILRSWDTGNRLARKKILEEFVKQYSNQTSATIEADFGNGGSLLLSRFSSWLKLSHHNGFELGLQIRALATFVSASSGANYLTEMLETGVIATVLEIFSGGEQYELTVVDITAGVLLLRQVASSGRLYKESLCQSDVVARIVDCLLEQRDVGICEGCRALLVELGTGNPKYSHIVLRGLLRLLPCRNPYARRIGAQVARMLLSSYSPHQYIGLDHSRGQQNRDNIMMAFVPVAISMIQSVDIQVQYEGVEVLKMLARESNAGPAIVAGIIPLLKTVRIKSVASKSSAPPSSTTVTDETTAISSVPVASPTAVASTSEFDEYYHRKASLCMGWQLAATRALLALCTAIPDISEYFVRADGMSKLFGVLVNASSSAGQRVALETISLIVHHVPEAIVLLNESVGLDVWKMIAPGGSEMPLKIPFHGEESKETISSLEEKVASVEVVLDDSDAFIESDLECSYLMGVDTGARVVESTITAVDETIKTPTPVEEDYDDGSDYKMLMSKIMKRSHEI